MAPSAKRLGQSVQKLASSAVAMIPAGNAGLAVKIAIGLVLSIWWTSGPGAQEESEFKASQEPPRSTYTRHYAFKGRGRKEFFLHDMKDDVNELVPTKAACKA